MRRAVLLDRDGVINQNRADYVKSWAEFQFLPGVLDALRQLGQTDLAIIVISNQSAIGRGLATAETVAEINRRMVEAIVAHGGRVDAVLVCPHRPEENCACRKPRPGLLLEAAQEHDLDLSSSYLIGDAWSDIAAGEQVDCQTILVLTGLAGEQMESVPNARRDRCHLATNLAEAVDWIVHRESRHRGGAAGGGPVRLSGPPAS